MVISKPQPSQSQWKIFRTLNQVLPHLKTLSQSDDSIIAYFLEMAFVDWSSYTGLKSVTLISKDLPETQPQLVFDIRWYFKEISYPAHTLGNSSLITFPIYALFRIHSTKEQKRIENSAIFRKLLWELKQFSLRIRGTPPGIKRPLQEYHLGKSTHIRLLRDMWSFWNKSGLRINYLSGFRLTLSLGDGSKWLSRGLVYLQWI